MSEPKKQRGGKKDPIDEGFLIPRVAALLIMGKSTTEIADTLNIGFNTVRKIREMEATQAMVRDNSDNILSVAKAVIRKKTAEMVELASQVLLEHLKKERSLEAVKLVFKVAGALSEEPVQKNQGSQSLTIVMPGAHAEKPAIEVTDDFSEQMDVQPGNESLDDNSERGI